MRNRQGACGWAVLGACALLGVLPAAALAQGNPNQFGGQDRADAASRMIVVGVQQGISSLPPTSGQSLTYEFDPKLDTYVTSERLGPTSFRTPQTIGAGKFSFRLATSYFELADFFPPIPYLVSDSAGNPLGAAALGLRANAKVGLVNLAGNYGVNDWLELALNLPIVIVDANATQLFSTSDPTGPASTAPLSGPAFNGTIDQTLADLNAALRDPESGLALREETFGAIGFDFNDGTHVGVGRISVAAKTVLYSGKVVQLAAMPEFFIPSPSEGQFAGSSSAAFLPRMIAAVRLADAFRLHLDAGYDYDFDSDELRRFVWNAGASVPMAGMTLDFGVGGSKFNEGITWTPDTATFGTPPNNGTIQALGDNTLGSNFIDALGGIKVRLAEKTVLSGAVNVPLNNEGFRADAVGTLAIEQYF